MRNETKFKANLTQTWHRSCGSLVISVGRSCHSRASQSSNLSWNELFEGLIWIDPNKIARVALDLVNERGEPREDPDTANLEPKQLWSLIGGLQGVEALGANSEVLIDLAFYAQQWYPEALSVTERMRLEARKLKWYMARLTGAARTWNLEVSFPFYAQRAVVSYYLMTRHLLALYEMASFSMLADLRKVL